MPTKRLVRPQNRVLFGVCSGLAAYFGIDPTIVRIVWVFLTFAGGSGIVLYIVLILLMPNGTPNDGITAAAPAPPAGTSLGGEVIDQVDGAIDRATTDAGGSGGGGNVT